MLTAASASADDEPVNNILANGDFEADENGDGYPDGWPKLDQTSWERDEDGNRFLRIEPSEPGKTIVLYRGVPLKGDPKVLDVSAKVRTHQVKRGSANWHDARIVMHFIADWGGSKIKPSPGAIRFKQDTNEWTEVTKRITVPEGARILEFMPSMFQVASGRFDLDDVTITPVNEQQATKDAAREARLNPKPKSEPVPVIDDLYAGPLPPMIHVVGNQLRTVESNERVWLQGLNIPSLEWAVGGEGVLESIRVAIDDWNANVIRLPVKDKFWFGDSEYQKDGGEGYRALVDACIHTAARRGVYTVLDLHNYRAPTPESVAFWQDAAQRYKNHPAVLFGLLNEPHSTSWEVWRNGGTITVKNKDGGETRYESPGMQGLLEAVRATGAKNIAVVGGLDWAYELDGVVEGYALKDAPDAHGIMYDTHIYHWKKDWAGKVLVAAEKYPLLVGEVGASPKKVDFVPHEAQENPATWVPDMIGLIQKHRLNWTAWSFHTKAWPTMLVNWHYEPTPFWGKPVKEALHGKQFEMKRMR